MSESLKLPESHEFSTILGNFPYVITPEQDESHFGEFPAAVTFHRNKHIYEVHRDEKTVWQLNQEYGTLLVPFETIEAAYIGTSLIDHYGLRMTKNKRALQEDLWETMSSPDGLNRQILDHPDENMQHKLFVYLGEELSPQIPRINGLRFAAGVLLASDPERFEELVAEMKRALRMRILGQEVQFLKVARVFTRGLEEARTAFAETIPLHEVAFAFPMTRPEVDRIIDLMQPSR